MTASANAANQHAIADAPVRFRVFHPPGAVRLVTPEESQALQAAQQRDVSAAAPADERRAAPQDEDTLNTTRDVAIARRHR